MGRFQPKHKYKIQDGSIIVMTALKIENVDKYFGKTKAVENVSLEVNENEMFFLLGTSGCGKTTTLRMIAGLEEVNKGRIQIKGRDVTRLPPQKRNIALVFQNWALFPHKTIRDNIGFGLRMQKKSRKEINDQVTSILEVVGMPGFENRLPGQLSGGQQQRVALARALVLNPDLLLLDEPLSNLDLNTRLNMRRELVEVHKRLGLTTIFVTHDQTEALAMADRIALMENGKLMEVGTPQEIYESPLTEFTARFIGEKNNLKGTVTSINELEQSVQFSENGILSVPVTARHPVDKGDNVTVFINAEKIRFTDLEQETGQNSFKAVVQDIMYLGTVKKYSVQLETGETIVHDQQTTKDVFPYEKGDRLRVIIDPEHCICIKQS